IFDRDSDVSVGQSELQHCGIGLKRRRARVAHCQVQWLAERPRNFGFRQAIVEVGRPLLSPASFPLTPTLSLGEREAQSSLRGEPSVAELLAALRMILPLPKGE